MGFVEIIILNICKISLCMSTLQDKQDFDTVFKIRNAEMKTVKSPDKSGTEPRVKFTISWPAKS